MVGKYKQGDCNDNIGYLIWHIFKYWKKMRQKILDEFGLTGSQMELLGAISYAATHQIEITQIALSQDTEIDPMTTSTLLRNMEKRGLISRHESSTDTRARVVKLTETGMELFTKAVSKIKKEKERLFVNVDIDILRSQLQILLKETEKLNNN
jgi:DNA-binding MarR family transcriptional regulator